MDRTKYKNDFNKSHYDRINLTVPAGYKMNIKGLASLENKSVNMYLLDLIKRETNSFYDRLQLPCKSRNEINYIMHTEKGYEIEMKSGKILTCSKSHEIKGVIKGYLAQDFNCLTQDF